MFTPSNCIPPEAAPAGRFRLIDIASVSSALKQSVCLRGIIVASFTASYPASTLEQRN
jgi:hypothetical protein